MWVSSPLLLCLLIFSALLLAAMPTLAKVNCSVRVQGLIIQAESCDRDTDADTLDLEGSVQVIFKDQHLTCDRTRVNFRARSLDAVGNVRLTSPQATVAGSRILLDYESNTGMIFDGFVQSGPVLFEGASISKLGESEYLANSAKFTACDNCPESWSFTGQRIRAQLGGYAFIKNSFLRVGGVPVFWLPYLIVPLKSDRQTGLLTPELETSDSGGLTFGQSVFWAIDRSQDATFTLKNYEKRGMKGLLNYRYVLSENSYGELDVAFLRDRVFGNDERLNAFRPAGESGQPLNRWFTKYEHYLDLPEGYIHRLQVNNASDLQYGIDYPLETQNHGDSVMENRMSLTKNLDGQHMSVDSSYYVNLLQYDPISSSNDSVHRLPEIRYSKTYAKLPNSDWLYNLDLNSTHFNRSDFNYDDLNAAYNPNGPNDRHLEAGPGVDCASSEWYNNKDCVRQRDGTFDPDRDLLRTGHRLDFRGSLTRPYRYGNFFDLIPKLSYRETTYQFNIPENSQNTRRFVRAEVAMKTVFSRVLGDLGNVQSIRYKHEIQPEVTLTAIPWLNHPSHPFFGAQQEVPFFSQENVSDSDLNNPYGLQFDFTDRVYDRKLVTMAVSNKITQKRWRAGNPEYRQIFFWRLAQSYDFYQQEAQSSVRQPLSDFLSDLRVTLDSFEVYSRANYFPYQQVTNASTRLRYNFPTGDFVQVAHVQNFRNIAPGQDIDPGRRTEDYTVSLRKRFPFGDILGRVTYDMNPEEGRENQRFKSYGYGAQMKLPGDCWYFNVTQYRTTGGENHFKVNFDFIWDGQKRPALPESLLDSLNF
jgi:LPS-assembly protein